MFEFLYVATMASNDLEVLRVKETALLAQLNQIRGQQLQVQQSKKTRSQLVIDFGRRYISSEEIEQCLAIIVDKVSSNANEQGWIILFMDENYLTTEDVRKLLQLIQSESDVGGDLRRRLRYIDFENNRISRREGFDVIKEIMKLCPKVEVNLEINNLGVEDKQYANVEEQRLISKRFKKYKRDE